MSQQAWRVPGRLDAFNFWCRSTLLKIAHGLREAWRPSVRRWSAGATLADAPILAQRRTPLWSDGRADEFPLVAGKVQNLRVARQAFHAVEVPAGEVFSFWRQLGRPSARRGFVEGREVREGCVVPALAGGICQISNALATISLQAGFELVERHSHSAHIEGAANDHTDNAIDATVFWNYIDLKVRATHAWRLELELSADELIMTIRGVSPQTGQVRHAPVILHTKPGARREARGCLTCQQTDCFRHRNIPAQPQAGSTALLLDGWSPEFAQYIEEQWRDAERFAPVPMRLAFWRATGIQWPNAARGGYRAIWPSLRRSVWLRLWARHSGGRRQSSIIDGQRWLAQAYARHLQPHHTHLVIDQGLLPHLSLLGVLEGRKIEVLATTLPMSAIEARLNSAAQCWPQEASLCDFRADASLVQAEQHGLHKAVRIVTAHIDAAQQFKSLTAAPVTLLPWTLPRPVAMTNTRSGQTSEDLPLVVFPASELARKGVVDLVAALKGLRCRLRILGQPVASVSVWDGPQVEYHQPHSHHDWLHGAHVVVLPAYVEHAPRTLLLALSSGVPVVATPACGLGERDGLHLVAAGDVAALRARLQSILAC